MSWEIDRITTKPCPCGKGIIKKTSESDDWNRFREYYSIECPICSDKYKVISESWYKDRGDYGTYDYLLEKDYPEYTGISVKDVFPYPTDSYSLSFELFVEKNYTLKEITEAKEQLDVKTSVTSLTGVASKIAKEHKKVHKTCSIKKLRDFINDALVHYNNLQDNKEKRIPIEKQEQEERKAYEDERRKHLISLNDF